MTPAELCRMAAERIHEGSARTFWAALLWPFLESTGLSSDPCPSRDPWRAVVRLRIDLFPEIDDDPACHRNARILALLLLGEILEEKT